MADDMATTMMTTALTGAASSSAWPGRARGCYGRWAAACCRPASWDRKPCRRARTGTSSRSATATSGSARRPTKDVVGTFQEAVARINALPTPPAFILHTGDLSQLAQADQFDTVDQVLKGAKTVTGKVFYVPGEHDVVGDGGKLYLERYGKGTLGGGWHSFDYNGVHFIGLVNVLELKAKAMGDLGAEQLAWLKNDVSRPYQPAFPSSSSRTFPCGKYTRSGAGGRRMPLRHFLF